MSGQRGGKEKRPLPTALARRAQRLAMVKKAGLAERARKDIRLIREKKETVESAFFQMGQALLRLAQPLVPQALGYRSFKELLAKELNMAVSTADRFMHVARRLHEADAIQWGSEKSKAVVDLMDSAGAPALPPGGKLAIGGGDVIDVTTASAAELDAAAKQLRHKKQSGNKRGRGRTTSKAERDLVARLSRAAKQAGLAATFDCLATKPGAPADLRIRLPLPSLPDLRRLLAKFKAD